jgi:ABC-2 type transport system permease protein
MNVHTQPPPEIAPPAGPQVGPDAPAPAAKKRARHGHGLSLQRFLAVLTKEFIQMRRDRVTFAMMVGLPIMQLLLFGFIINSDARHLPTLVEMDDSGPLSRAVIAGMKMSEYFDIQAAASGSSGEEALRSGRATFVVVFPQDFERSVVRGLHPDILVVADASDPSAVGGAVGALSGIVQTAMAETLTGPLAYAAPTAAPFGVSVQKKYNPEGKTSTNIVPGLLAIILSMTMVMMTAIAIVKESERGTMEMLISTPVRPAEVMAGKILPYVFVGYVQTIVFLAAGLTLFDVPFDGSWGAFFLGFNLFIIVNLALGFLISAVTRSQMQAMQLSVFTILPSVLLSGFLFPFAAMPGWAQIIGNIVPATHFLRIVRSVMLKGGGVGDVGGELGALLITLAVVSVIAMLRYRQTLD